MWFLFSTNIFLKLCICLACVNCNITSVASLSCSAVFTCNQLVPISNFMLCILQSIPKTVLFKLLFSDLSFSNLFSIALTSAFDQSHLPKATATFSSNLCCTVLPCSTMCSNVLACACNWACEVCACTVCAVKTTTLEHKLPLPKLYLTFQEYFHQILFCLPLAHCSELAVLILVQFLCNSICGLSRSQLQGIDCFCQYCDLFFLPKHVVGFLCTIFFFFCFN